MNDYKFQAALRHNSTTKKMKTYNNCTYDVGSSRT